MSIKNIEASPNLLGAIVRFCIDHPDDNLVFEFVEGDSYEVRFDTDDYDNNDEDPDSPEYQEWYVLIFDIERVIVDGPNRDPRFNCFNISEQYMPQRILWKGQEIYCSE